MFTFLPTAMSTLRTKGFSLPLSAGSSPCRVSHSRCPLIKLQPCSLLSCWQTKVLKRTPSVIASNLRHNVAFHVNCSQRKGSCCSLCLFFTPYALHFHYEECIFKMFLCSALLSALRRTHCKHLFRITQTCLTVLCLHR